MRDRFECLGIKTPENLALLCDILRENLVSKEFFINKAIGWSLRQDARINPKAVKKFVRSAQLHPLSRREALKHIEE
jgi:3-methyladenine DNA glycosylase AlkD